MTKTWGKRKRDGQSYIKGDQSVPISGGGYDVVVPPTHPAHVKTINIPGRHGNQPRVVAYITKGDTVYVWDRPIIKVVRYAQNYNSGPMDMYSVPGWGETSWIGSSETEHILERLSQNPDEFSSYSRKDFRVKDIKEGWMYR